MLIKLKNLLHLNLVHREEFLQDIPDTMNHLLLLLRLWMKAVRELLLRLLEPCFVSTSVCVCVWSWTRVLYFILYIYIYIYTLFNTMQCMLIVSICLPSNLISLYHPPYSILHTQSIRCTCIYEFINSLLNTTLHAY